MGAGRAPARCDGPDPHLSLMRDPSAAASHLPALPVIGRPTELAPDRLADWDSLTVDRPGGHVLQSLAWARHRAGAGWRAHFLRFDDGVGVLALVRPWPVVGGSGAYIPRGPIPAADDPATTAARLGAVVEWLAGRGVDVVASDAEIAASTGYGAMLAALGFHPIEELQPARHRLSLPLPAGIDEDALSRGVTKSTRQRIRQAERGGLRVVRFDARAGADPGEGFAVDDAPGALDAALGRAYDLATSTGTRRGFRLEARTSYVAWWRAAHDAGHLVVLEARDPGAGDEAVATLVLYRHGERLTTAVSGDRADSRTRHPGVFHLLRWRAIQLALRAGCEEMDLGGVDVAGARDEPKPGDRMAGLYEHKRSFGAAWVELTGAHERVIDGPGYLAGRATLGAAGVVRRVRARVGGR